MRFGIGWSLFALLTMINCSQIDIPGECIPDEIQECTSEGYLGACKIGKKTCERLPNKGFGRWSECMPTLPSMEDCDEVGIDEDCDGLVNEEGPHCTCGDGFVSNAESCDPALPPWIDTKDSCSSKCVLRSIIDLSVGQAHACALLHDQKVKCWGQHSNKNLGIRDAANTTVNWGDELSEMGDKLPHVKLSSDDPVYVRKLQAGSFHRCAEMSNGALKCWGKNDSGQLGRGGALLSSAEIDYEATAEGPPAVDLGFTNIGGIASGGSHTCIWLESGLGGCWGNNGGGQLGRNSDEQYWTGPKGMTGLIFLPFGDIKKIVGGENHSCALLTSGDIHCWGSNDSGQLGRGTDIPSAGRNDIPLDSTGAVTLGEAALDLVAGAAHTCALLTSGRVKCWGTNASGQLGICSNDTPIGRSMFPLIREVQFENGINVLELAAGAGHTCALVEYKSGSTRHVRCWGENNDGQLGVGDKNPRGKADPIGDTCLFDLLVDLGLEVAKTFPSAIRAGGNQTCAILSDGSVKCWGSNSDGQLGVESTEQAIGDSPQELGKNLQRTRLFTANW